MHLYNSINWLEGFYRVGKVFDVGNTVLEDVTILNLDTVEYKHKGLLIDPISTTTDAVVGFKFYDQSRPDGKSSDYINLTITRIQTSPPFILPCKVSSIRIVNTPTETYKIRVALLN